MVVLRILILLSITCFSLGTQQCTDIDDPVFEKVKVLDCVKNCDGKPCIQNKLNNGNIELRIYTDTKSFDKDYVSLSYDHLNLIVKQCFKYKQCCEDCSK